MPGRKRKADDVCEPSSEEESSDGEVSDDVSMEASTSEAASDTQGFDCYVVGHTKIQDAKATIDKGQNLPFPVNVPSFHGLHVRPVHVTSGFRHSIILGSDKKVYAWGCNAHGQLGVAPSKLAYSYEWVPIKVLTNKRVCQIACGSNHCLALTELGMVFAWGSNSNGQLGTTLSKEMRAEPKPVPKICLVTQVAGAGNASYAVDKQGDLYVWGDGEAGQFGLGGAPKVVGKPTKVGYFEENDVEVEAVAASAKHVLVRSGKQVYGSGDGSWGRLGDGQHGEHYEFKEIDIDFDEPETNLHVSVSANASYLLTAMKSPADGEDTSRVRLCGKVGPGGDSVLSFVDLKDAPVDRVAEIQGGRDWHMLRTVKGVAYYWGKNDACGQMGVLGRDMKHTRTVPHALQVLEGRFVHSVSCAAHYALLFVDRSKSTELDEKVAVPVFGREPPAMVVTKTTKTHTFETRRKAFLQSCEGGGFVAADDVSEATLDGPSREVKGASNLREGDEVSVWMTDVWAWAKITAVKPDNMFEVKWTRADWPEPMDVELLSDNEDVDGESDERWTYGFYRFWDSDDETEDSSSEESEEPKPKAKKAAKKAAKKVAKKATKKPAAKASKSSEESDESMEGSSSEGSSSEGDGSEGSSTPESEELPKKVVKKGVKKAAKKPANRKR
eukprot:TRINITY_DN5950_c0_g1_i1.p1 TRINITY_DN5950_c0_g1~~TRINITY_DN5950_c0_g1_i1.p1  ORF type:complete len:668 (+),score=163.90 TRINITY_DN5950_c0_g1_i1:51-2054(+)